MMAPRRKRGQQAALTCARKARKARTYENHLAPTDPVAVVERRERAGHAADLVCEGGTRARVSRRTDVLLRTGKRQEHAQIAIETP